MKRPSCTVKVLACDALRFCDRHTSLEAADGSRHLYLPSEQSWYAWKEEEYDQSEVCRDDIKRDFPPVDRHHHKIYLSRRQQNIVDVRRRQPKLFTVVEGILRPHWLGLPSLLFSASISPRNFLCRRSNPPPRSYIPANTRNGS